MLILPIFLNVLTLRGILTRLSVDRICTCFRRLRTWFKASQIMQLTFSWLDACRCSKRSDFLKHAIASLNVHSMLADDMLSIVNKAASAHVFCIIDESEGVDGVEVNYVADCIEEFVVRRQCDSVCFLHRNFCAWLRFCVVKYSCRLMTAWSVFFLTSPKAAPRSKVVRSAIAAAGSSNS